MSRPFRFNLRRGCSIFDLPRKSWAFACLPLDGHKERGRLSERFGDIEMRTLHLSALCGLLAATPALAEGPAYLDDRSSPAALVKSLYNAINRQEYARALAYFAEPPVDTVEEFAETFHGTERMRVVTGTPGRDGEGTDLRFEMPLAVEVTDEDGDIRVLAGCYTILGQSADGEAGAFRPYRIEGGLGRGHGDHEQREHVPGHERVGAVVDEVERDEVHVHRVQHQLDAHQHEHRVAPGDHPVHPDAEDERPQQERPHETHVSSPSWALTRSLISATSAMISLGSRWRLRGAGRAGTSSSIGPDSPLSRRDSTIAPISAASSSSPATSNGRIQREKIASPISPIG
jgi:hypothetical protein